MTVRNVLEVFPLISVACICQWREFTTYVIEPHHLSNQRNHLSRQKVFSFFIVTRGNFYRNHHRVSTCLRNSFCCQAACVSEVEFSCKDYCKLIQIKVCFLRRTKLIEVGLKLQVPFIQQRCFTDLLSNGLFDVLYGE